MERGGAPILRCYKTFHQALKTIYPEHDWNPLDRSVLPREEFWKDQKNHRLLMDRIVQQLELDSPLQLAKIGKKKILLAGGRSLFTYYPTLFEALGSIYPELSWDVFEFKPFPKRFWDDPRLQRRFLDRFVEQRGIPNVPEGWKGVTSRDIHLAGGVSILSRYSSFSEMLKFLYPEMKWNIFEDRNVVPRNFWDERANLVEFLRRVEDRLQIKAPKDWERVSLSQIAHMGGGGLIQKFGTLHKVLERAFPEEAWDQFHLNGRDKRASQRFLYLQIRNLFPHCEVIEDYIHEHLSRVSGIHVEFDVFIPDHSIAFEYQGEHHYREIPSFGSIDLYQKRDEEKKSLCLQHHVHLAVIPFWWDNTTESLHSLLLSQLPQGLAPKHLKKE